MASDGFSAPGMSGFLCIFEDFSCLQGSRTFSARVGGSSLCDGVRNWLLRLNAWLLPVTSLRHFSDIRKTLEVLFGYTILMRRLVVRRDLWPKVSHRGGSGLQADLKPLSAKAQCRKICTAATR